MSSIPSNNIVADIADRLAQQVETFTAYLLPNGKRDGAYWVVGSISGERGQSLKVTLTGDKAGKWVDYADDTQHGDLLDLLAAVRSITLSDALREAKDYLGLSGTSYNGQAYKPIQRPPKPKEPPEQATQRREKDERKRQKAQAYWDRGKPCKSHPYLIRKEVEPTAGMRVLNGDLLIPIRDDKWRIISVQTIQPDGTKRFLKDCKMAGGRFAIGKVTDNTLIIAEGYATAASIHQATGLCIAIAFSSGNLPKVAATARKKKPELKIILAPDNDQ